MTLHFVLMLLAVVCFFLAAITNYQPPNWPNWQRLMAAGLCLWSLATIVTV